jgi:hypothetical protein
MGVPISFLDKYCPEQFEILGLSELQDIEVATGIFQTPTRKINDVNVYHRIWIKHKNLIEKESE